MSRARIYRARVKECFNGRRMMRYVPAAPVCIATDGGGGDEFERGVAGRIELVCDITVPQLELRESSRVWSSGSIGPYH